MVDPISAVQLASGVVQLADFGFRVSVRIKAFAKENIELPEKIQDVAVTLTTICSALKVVGQTLEKDSIKNERRLQDVVNAIAVNAEQMQIHCDELQKKLDEYLPQSNATPLERVNIAIRSMRADKKIELLVGKINEDSKALHMSITSLHFYQSEAWRAASQSRPSVDEHLSQRRFYTVPHRHVPYSKFVSRDDILDNVKRQFLVAEANGEAPKIVTLGGMGGQGKTQLALRYASCRWNEDCRGVFWIDAASRATVTKGFEQISELIKFKDQQFGDSSTRIDSVKAALAEWSSNWLIVFDNYDDFSTSRAPSGQFASGFDIRDYFPCSKIGEILITSRNNRLRELGLYVEINGMTEDQALNLFYLRSEAQRTDTSDEHVKKLVQRLGFLPLTIIQLATYFRKRRFLVPLGKLPEVYETHVKEILEESPGFVESISNSDDNVVKKTAWNMTYSLLNPGHAHDARKLEFLHLLVYFNEAEISEELFFDYLQDLHHRNDRPDWTALFVNISSDTWSVENFRTRFHELVNELLDLTLLSSLNQQSGDYITISMHPLVRDFIKASQNKNERLRSFRNATVVLATSLKSHFKVHPAHEVFGNTIFNITSDEITTYMCHLSVWYHNFPIWKEISQPLCLETPTHGFSVPVECLFSAFSRFGDGHESEIYEVLDWATRRAEKSSDTVIRSSIVHLIGPLLYEIWRNEGTDAARDKVFQLLDFYDHQRPCSDKESIGVIYACIYWLITTADRAIKDPKNKSRLLALLPESDELDSDEEIIRYVEIKNLLALLEINQGSEVRRVEGVRILHDLFQQSESHPMGSKNFRRKFWSYTIWKSIIKKMPHNSCVIKALLEEVFQNYAGSQYLQYRAKLWVAKLMSSYKDFENALMVAGECLDVYMAMGPWYSPKIYECLIEMGLAANRLGEFSKAIDFLEQALSLPSLESLRRYCSRFYLFKTLLIMKSATNDYLGLKNTINNYCEEAANESAEDLHDAIYHVAYSKLNIKFNEDPKLESSITQEVFDDVAHHLALYLKNCSQGNIFYLGNIKFVVLNQDEMATKFGGLYGFEYTSVFMVAAVRMFSRYNIPEDPEMLNSMRRVITEMLTNALIVFKQENIERTNSRRFMRNLVSVSEHLPVDLDVLMRSMDKKIEEVDDAEEQEQLREVKGEIFKGWNDIHEANSKSKKDTKQPSSVDADTQPRIIAARESNTTSDSAVPPKMLQTTPPKRSSRLSLTGMKVNFKEMQAIFDQPNSHRRRSSTADLVAKPSLFAMGIASPSAATKLLSKKGI